MHAGRGAPADEHAAQELVMFIENTSDLSPDGPSGQGRSVLLNALRKWRKGTYDPARAVTLFGYLVESGAKRYAKEFSSSPREWSTMFTPATRREAAGQLEASFRNSVKNGEYDHVDTRIGAREMSESSAHGWTVEAGRQICFNGQPFAHIAKEGNTSPVEADGFTHLVVNLLNRSGDTPESIYEQHMGHSRRNRR